MGVPENALNGLCAVSAHEMRELQAKVQVLEDVVFDVLERGTKPTSQELRSLQDFDLVSQTLAGLGQFFDALREQTEETGESNFVEATENITLEKLRMRLRTEHAATQA